MNIRLLGEFDVTVEGRPATPSSKAEGALLALLALQPGRVVDAERLVDVLWGEDLPANPANALQLRVSKLRRRLASAGSNGVPVVTRPPGYVLDLSPDAVDVARFTAAVEQARALASAGDPHGALQKYRAAVTEWRGEALSGFRDAAWAEGEARRLESLAITAAEERLQLEIDGGNHAEVLDELSRLVEQHPLRERLHGLRMLALYRSGRQAEALEAFQHAREVLEEELGLDPSPQLRALETAILQHDPRLAGAERPDRGRATLQTNLPAARQTILGREEALAELTALLDEHRLLTLTGPGGAGKTTVATELARRSVDGFPDGAWFVGLADIVDDADLVGIVADALGLPPAEALAGESVHDRIARQLGTRTALLVIDNCEHVIDGAAALVDRLLSRCPSLKVIATSREALATAGEVQYALGPLAVPEAHADEASVAGSPAVQLFLERAAAASGRSLGEDELHTVAGICRDLDGMPLAIELAAARTKMLTVTQIASRLEDRFALLSAGPRTADRRHRTLRATIDWSHQLLEAGERRLLRRLGVFYGAFSLEAVEEVCGDPDLPVDDALDVLGRLVDRSLVVRTDDGLYRLLETVRVFARERLIEAGEGEAFESRNLDRLRQHAEVAAAVLRGPQQDAALRDLYREQDGLRAALAFCAARPDRFGSVGLRLAAQLAWFWYLGDHEEGRRQLHRMLQVCDIDADPQGRALALEALSYVERPSACVVHPSEICAEVAAQAIPLFAQVGDELGVARGRVLAAVEAVRGTGTSEALATLDDVERTFEAVDDCWWLAMIAFVRMEILVRTDRSDTAINWGREAARRFEELGDRWGISSVHGHLCHNLSLLGRYDEALEAGQRALTMARDVGLANSVQMMSAEVGLQLLATGDDERAEGEFATARTVAQRYGYLTGDATGAAGQAFLARRRGHLELAVTRFEESIELLTRAGSTGYLSTVYAGLGYVLELQGRALEAAAAHRKAFDSARTFPDPGFVATAWECQARTALTDAAPGRALGLLTAAAALRERTHRPVPAVLAADVAGSVDTVRALVGEEAFLAGSERARRGDLRLDIADRLPVEA